MGLRNVCVEGAPPDNSDDNGTKITFQDMLLKGITEQQRPGFRRARGCVWRWQCAYG